MYVNFFSPVCLKRQLKVFPSYLMSIKLFKERGILKEANSETKLAPLKEITTAPRPLVRNSERILKNVCLVSLLSNYFSSNNWDSWSYTIDILFPISEKLRSPWKKWTWVWCACRWWKESGQNNKRWSICKSLIHF